jgi:hypothetical protein
MFSCSTVFVLELFQSKWKYVVSSVWLWGAVVLEMFCCFIGASETTLHVCGNRVHVEMQNSIKIYFLSDISQN